MQTAQQISQQLWSYCKYLRDDGVAALDYLPQLAMLLFLKMASEHHGGGDASTTALVAQQWSDLCSQEEDQLLAHYTRVLGELGHQSGMVGAIYRHAQVKVRRPAILARLIREIDAVRWSDIEYDVLAEAYESILGRTTEDVKSGAGQYFTPRPLIQAIIDVLRPEPGQRICDPACGTGGFLIEAQKYLLDHYQLTSEQRWNLQHATFYGGEIVEETARLCLMNLLLHGIGSEEGDMSPITVGDSLQSVPRELVDQILTNPPFGQDRGGLSMSGRKRRDFCCETSNKQLNFVQHAVTLLKPNGKCAIIVPDNVLFAKDAGEKIRRWLLSVCDVHTLLRLPTGIFYAPGVKANVLFFQKRSPRFDPWTTRLWVYDMRTDTHFTPRTNALTRADLDDFVQSFHTDDLAMRKENSRFQCYSYEALIKRENCNLDLFKVRKESHTVKANDERLTEAKQAVRVVPQELAHSTGSSKQPVDPKRVEIVLQNFRRMFPKGSRIYISIASEIPLLVKFYAIYGSSIISLDHMLSVIMPGFRHVHNSFTRDKGILHDDEDTVTFMVDAIGRQVWQDGDAYGHDWLPE